MIFFDTVNINVYYAYLFFFISLALTLLYLTCLVKEDIEIYGNIIISKFEEKNNVHCNSNM